MDVVIMHEATNGTDDSESVRYERSKEFVQVSSQPLSIRRDGRMKSSEFNRLPTRNPIDITFKDIVYNAPLGLGKGTKEILHKINGRILPGQLVAIMGPSGAGKSTLLDVLSGYRKKGIEGTVYINGAERSMKSFRKTSCYITQDDRLQPLLTVRESMEIAADLKLATTVSQAEKRRIINEILYTLGLSKAKNTEARGLSGGQRKRLSIALELISNPLVMFLDEPTTGLDSSSCSQCLKLLKVLASQGRTIVCTIHQPSAHMFSMFDLVYVLSEGKCLYQGSTSKMVQFLDDVGFPCPMYHNPADYVIDLACEEYGPDKIPIMMSAMQNGKSLRYYEKPEVIPNFTDMKDKAEYEELNDDDDEELQVTSAYNQLKVLLRRGYIKAKRDRTLTYMRLIVNFLTGVMLGSIYWQAGQDGSKVTDNYNLLFSILIHHMMSTMMLTILTFPTEFSILIKEHFNRWYKLKMYYLSVTIVEIPIAIASCFIFTAVIYYMTHQPFELNRFGMFFAISLLVVFVAQSFGLVIGAIFDAVNGTFLGPTLSVPIMMFAGFGVSLKDLPSYLYWGSYISYLRYGLEGIVGAIYGMERPTLSCPEDKYCHYMYPKKLLTDIDIKPDQFWNDVIALLLNLFFLRIASYVFLRYKLMAVR